MSIRHPACARWLSGPSNENYTVIEQGLNEGEDLYLSLRKSSRFKWQGEELILYQEQA